MIPLVREIEAGVPGLLGTTENLLLDTS